MPPTFRLSRIRAPRATLAASVLVVVVFVAFGMAVSLAAEGRPTVAPDYARGTPMLTFATWLSCG
ncbi:MAG: hypothetical protein ACODAC_11275 [Pseudomonadota bacterium]